MSDEEKKERSWWWCTTCGKNYAINDFYGECRECIEKWEKEKEDEING